MVRVCCGSARSAASAAETSAAALHQGRDEASSLSGGDAAKALAAQAAAQVKTGVKAAGPAQRSA
jgi:hypothetical protein